MTGYNPPLTPNFTADVTAPSFAATGKAGATAASRYAGATNSGAPIAGTFIVGDFVVDRTGALWVCTVAGSPGTWVGVGAGSGIFAGEVQALDFKVTGLTGATAGARFAGAVLLGAPVSGTFVAGDFIVDRTGTIWVCTVSGSPGTWVNVQSSVFAGEVQGTDFKATGLTGATQASRYVGATAAGSPGTGTFAVGDTVIDRSGHIYICTVAGSPGTWVEAGNATFLPIASPTFTGTITGPTFTPSGLTGASSASRWVGATTGGAPVSGTFAVGDFIIDRSGAIYVCTVAGSPGTWVTVGAGSGVFAGEVQAQDFKTTGLTGATQASRYAGATSSGAPVSGTFAVGDFIIDRTGAIYVCTVAGSPGTWVATGGTGTFPGEVQGTDFKPTGLTGAVQASRYVGATASGAPASGTFAVGDFIVDRTGVMYVCTVAGSPGTWIVEGSGVFATKASPTITGTITNNAGTINTGNVAVTNSVTWTGGSLLDNAIRLSAGKNGAGSQSQWVGAVSGAAPAGTYAASVGDWVIDRNGGMWVCTVAGTPGTWAAVGSPAGTLAKVNYQPGVQQTYNFGALAAFDTTNLRVTGTVPASGAIEVALEGVIDHVNGEGHVDWCLVNHGTTTIPNHAITEMGSPITNPLTGGTLRLRQRATFLLTGLTPGAAFDYDWAGQESGAGGTWFALQDFAPAIMTVRTA